VKCWWELKPSRIAISDMASSDSSKISFARCMRHSIWNFTGGRPVLLRKRFMKCVFERPAVGAEVIRHRHGRVGAWARLHQSLGETSPKSGRDLGKVWARLHQSLGETWAKSGRDLGKVWARLHQSLGETAGRPPASPSYHSLVARCKASYCICIIREDRPRDMRPVH